MLSTHFEMSFYTNLLAVITSDESRFCPAFIHHFPAKTSSANQNVTIMSPLPRSRWREERENFFQEKQDLKDRTKWKIQEKTLLVEH